MSANNKPPRRRAKSNPHGQAHGGSWKVAYADFVTALMAFFLLMWLLNALSPQQKHQLSGYFQDYGLFESSSPAGPSITEEPQASSVTPASEPEAAATPETTEQPPAQTDQTPPTPPETVSESDTQALEKFKDNLTQVIAQQLADLKDQIIVDPFDHGVRIQVVDSQDRPIFDLGGTTLTPPAVEALKVIAASLNGLDNKVSIEGHTDSLSYSSDRYTNWELSTDRASAARRQLEKFGLNPDRLLRVSGYAASDPLIKDDPQDPRNRRISILVYDKGYHGPAEAGPSRPVPTTDPGQGFGVSVTTGRTAPAQPADSGTQ